MESLVNSAFPLDILIICPFSLYAKTIATSGFLKLEAFFLDLADYQTRNAPQFHSVQLNKISRTEISIIGQPRKTE